MKNKYEMADFLKSDIQTKHVFSNFIKIGTSKTIVIIEIGRHLQIDFSKQIMSLF